MINRSFFIAFIITIVSWVVYRFILFKRNKQINIIRESILFIFLIYFLILLGMTVFKGFSIEFYNQFDSYMYKREGIFGIINVVPFKETIETLSSGEVPIKMPLRNIFGNILIFMPLGFIIPILFNKYNDIYKIIKLGIVSSLSIEIVQLFVGYNICDIDDVVFNTTGAILGFLCYRILNKIKSISKFKDKLEDASDNNTENINFKSFKIIIAISIIVLLSYTYSIYTQTASSKLSDEELAQKLFTRNVDSEFLDCKNLGDKKFYLVKDDFGVGVQSLVKYTKTRYANTYEGHGYYNSDEVGYNISIVHDYNNNNGEVLNTILIIGKNEDAKYLELTLLGKTHRFELQKNEYFYEIYPQYLDLDESIIDEIYSGNNSDNFIVKFFDDNGKEIKSIKCINP